MCGLVGMIGAIDNKLEKAMKDLLALDVIRGPHSTGLYVQYPNRQDVLLKKAMLPQDFFSLKSFEEAMRPLKRIIIGHNRWATQGRINSVNAHPFEIGDIIGAHNGTLRAQWLLPDNQRFDVDSENIIHSLDKDGTAETIKKLNGAYALTWYDWKDDTLNICRNAERPLFGCLVDDERAMVWASERWMLHAALGRNGIEHTDPIKFDVDKHYKFKVPEDRLKGSKVVLLSEDEVEVYKMPPVKTYPNNYGGRNIPVKKHGNVITIIPTTILTENSLLTGDAIEIVIPNNPVFEKDFVMGRLIGGQTQVKIHIRCTSRIATLMKKGGVFLGTVMGYRPKDVATNKGGYISVQDNSVIEYELDKKKPNEKKREGWNGEEFTEEEFKSAKLDCCWCTSPIQFDDDDAAWIDGQNVVCGDCQDNKEVKEHIANCRGGGQ